jgi:hypothetical protein
MKHVGHTSRHEPADDCRGAAEAQAECINDLGCDDIKGPKGTECLTK